jgi:hypothetical protein
MRNSHKLILNLILIFFMQLYFAYTVCSAAESSCVTCHSNESLMKSLHKPPPMPEGESGEG